MQQHQLDDYDVNDRHNKKRRQRKKSLRLKESLVYCHLVLLFEINLRVAVCDFLYEDGMGIHRLVCICFYIYSYLLPAYLHGLLLNPPTFSVTKL